jgi:RimJ/RimL family protein N-acetyltransferase
MAMPILEQHIIPTARLILRPVRAGDAAHIFELIANREVLRYLSSPPWPYEPEHARAFVDVRMRPDPNVITHVIAHDGALVGVIDAVIKPAGAAQPQRGYAIGYWLGQPYWARGLMSEAARAFIAHVFATIGDDTIYSGALSENIASLRIQEKLGFIRDSETALFIPAHGKELPSTNTSLTRARFAELAA